MSQQGKDVYREPFEVWTHDSLRSPFALYVDKRLPVYNIRHFSLRSLDSEVQRFLEHGPASQLFLFLFYS